MPLQKILSELESRRREVRRNKRRRDGVDTGNAKLNLGAGTKSLIYPLNCHVRWSEDTPLTKETGLMIRSMH